MEANDVKQEYLEAVRGALPNTFRTRRALRKLSVQLDRFFDEASDTGLVGVWDAFGEPEDFAKQLGLEEQDRRGGHYWMQWAVAAVAVCALAVSVGGIITANRETEELKKEYAETQKQYEGAQKRYEATQKRYEEMEKKYEEAQESHEEVRSLDEKSYVVVSSIEYITDEGSEEFHETLSARITYLSEPEE